MIENDKIPKAELKCLCDLLVSTNNDLSFLLTITQNLSVKNLEAILFSELLGSIITHVNNITSEIQWFILHCKNEAVMMGNILMDRIQMLAFIIDKLSCLDLPELYYLKYIRCVSSLIPSILFMFANLPSLNVTEMTKFLNDSFIKNLLKQVTIIHQGLSISSVKQKAAKKIKSTKSKQGSNCSKCSLNEIPNLVYLIERLEQEMVNYIQEKGISMAISLSAVRDFRIQLQTLE